MKCPGCDNDIPNIYPICPFCETILPVVVKKEKVLPEHYTKFKKFTQNMAPVATKDNKWGYIDRDGNEVIQPKYDDAKNFSENMAAIGVKKNGKILYGYINIEDECIIQPQYIDAKAFKDNKAAVQTHSGKWMIVDVENNPVVEETFDEITAVSNGAAIVKNANKIKILKF